MANTSLVMRFLAGRKQKKYPDAFYWLPLIGEVLAAFSEENYPFDYTPASIVSQNMLNKSIAQDFESSIKLRHLEETGSADVHQEEIQGYVDSVALYIAACFTAVNDLLIMQEALNLSPQFTRLPHEVRLMSGKFVRENESWALSELRESDLVDGRNFTNKLVKRVAEKHSDPFYQRGSRTARDTLLLHVDLAQAFLAGRLQ